MSCFGGSAGWPSCYPPTVSSQWLSVDAPESEAESVKALEDAYKAKMDAIAKFNCTAIPIGRTEVDPLGVPGGVMSMGTEDEGAVGTDFGGSGGNDSEDVAEEEAESSRGGDDDEQDDDEDEEMYESSDQGMESLDFDQ